MKYFQFLKRPKTWLIILICTNIITYFRLFYTQVQLGTFSDTVVQTIPIMARDSYFLGCRDHIEDNLKCHKDAETFLHSIIDMMGMKVDESQN